MKYYLLSQSDHDNIISTLEKRDGPIINTYYYTLVDIITLSLQCFHRVTATRIDLRYPQSLTADDMPCIDISIRDDAMTRFCKSLQAKLNSLVNRKRKKGDRVRDHTFHYLWVRERHQSNYPHYHVVLLFCKDTFYTTGRYDDPESLAGLITAAWASACGVYINHKTDPALFSLFTGSVYFAKQGTYHLDINADSNTLHASITELLLRAGYLAKQAHKPAHDAKRNMGCSIRTGVTRHD